MRSLAHCGAVMGMGRTILAAGLLLALAGCGQKKPADGGATASVEDRTVAELQRFQAEENARSRVTLVDAATADAAAMPPEWSGPTAYDLRAKEGETEAPEPEPPTKIASSEPNAAPPTAPQEEFPSVAE